MAKRLKSILIKFPGTNCDRETVLALELAGFDVEVILWRKLEQDASSGRFLKQVALIVFAGGFSYGDDIFAGKIASQLVKNSILKHIKKFVKNGGYVLGICNGFQILCQLNLVPGTLIKNKNGKFLCRWLELENCTTDNDFLKKLPQKFELPIACAEGNFRADEIRVDEIPAKQIVLKYKKDYLGSEAKIAGVSDKSGRILGLMPHPERYIFIHQHPDANMIIKNNKQKYGWGWYFFCSLYDSIKKAKCVFLIILLLFGN